MNATTKAGQLAGRAVRRIGITLFTREKRRDHWGVTLVGVFTILFSLYMISKMGNPDYSPQIICHAARCGNFEAVKHFLWKDMSLRDAEAGGLSVLHWAVIGGNVEVVKLLAHHGADINRINAYGVTPLHIAAAEDNAKVLRYLLHRKAAINAEDRRGSTPLDYAQAYGREAVVEFLKQRGGESRFPIPEAQERRGPQSPEENEIA